MTPEEPFSSAELATKITEIISEIIGSFGVEDFAEATGWLTKIGLGEDKVKEDLIKRVAETLSKELSGGLLQLTVEEIGKEKKYKDAVSSRRDLAVVAHLSKYLSPLRVYVEFVVRFGSIEMKKIRYDFKVESTVEVKDVKVTIREGRIRSLDFGLFTVTMKLYLLKENKLVELGKKTMSLKLPGPIPV